MQANSDEKLKKKKPAKGYAELDEERTEPSVTLEENRPSQPSPEVSPREEEEGG
jgi:hypothetical protein